jgi:hypothetical protein
MIKGVWTFEPGSSNLLSDVTASWKPQAVWIYKTGNEPAVRDLASPHGVWGIAPGENPDEDGFYAPSDTWFYAPGETPPENDDWQPQGTWSAPGADWPPSRESSKKKLPETKRSDSKEPRSAWVFPQKKITKQALEKDKPKGFWKYAPGKKVMDAGKNPKEVLMYENGEEPSNFDQSKGGMWGYAPGAEPDEDGNYAPSDIWFFAPKETPPEDWRPIGIWTFKVASKEPAKNNPKPTTPPKQEKNKRVRRYPNSVFVYPSIDKAPQNGEKNNHQGVWAISPGKPDGKAEDDGEPLEIIIHKKGKEPDKLDKTPHGVWGYANGATPDGNGVIDPKDMLFYPPGQMPPSDIKFEPAGVWSFPGARIEESFTYRFEGADMLYFKKTEIFFMDTVTTFTSEFKK